MDFKKKNNKRKSKSGDIMENKNNNIEEKYKKAGEAQIIKGFWANKKGSIEIDEEFILEGLKGIIVGCLVLGVVIGGPTIGFGLADAHFSKDYDAFVVTENNDLGLEISKNSESSFQVQSVNFEQVNGAYSMVINCKEATKDGKILDKIISYKLTEEQFNEVTKLQSQFNKAEDSSKFTQKGVDKKKAVVQKYFDAIEEIINTAESYSMVLPALDGMTL